VVREVKKILLALLISFSFITGISVLAFCSQENDPESDVSFLLQVAEDCIEEISQSTVNNVEEIEDLVEDYEVIVQDIENSIEEATFETGLLRAIEAVSSGTANHLEVLQSLLNKVPEEARDAIEHAIEVSQHGRETALNRLQEILEKKRERERERAQNQEEKRYRKQRREQESEDESEYTQPVQEDEQTEADIEEPEEIFEEQEQEQFQPPGKFKKPKHPKRPKR